MKRNDKPTWLMLLRDIAEVAVSVALFGLLLWAFLWVLVNGFKEIGDALKLRADTVSEDCGVGRATASLNGVLLLGGETDEPERNTALRVYTEGVDNPLPEWWDPDGAILMWEDHFGEGNKMVDDDLFTEAGNMVEAEPHPPAGISQGGIDWNVESAIYGWDGHMMTGVELDLFSRITYLEFWGASKECMNAGIDSILNLWSSEYFGRTLFETLSATAENGAFVYTTYGYAYDWDYDYTALKEIKALCLKRFVEGPRYNCCFFQLYGFPAWAEPLYAIDSVYFSTFKEGTWN